MKRWGLLDRDIVWNDRENNNFSEINFDNNHVLCFDSILNQYEKYSERIACLRYRTDMIGIELNFRLR